MTSYLAIITKEPQSDYGVHFPDFPGCVSVASSVKEAQETAIEALAGHIALMEEDGEILPQPSTYEDIMNDKENHGGLVFEVNPKSYDPFERVNITLPSSLLREISKENKNRSAFLAEAAREKLGLK